jgi:Flp pilus assembly protein protease CpaA
MFSTLMLLLIASYDLWRHRIPNVLLLSLALSVLLREDVQMQLTYAIAVTLLALFAYWSFGLGGGDVKLLFIIALFLTPADRISEYWTLFSIIGLVLTLLAWLKERSLSGNIALAPALCGAVLCISPLNHI